MTQPLVSIIVPTYNVERYVEECLDSLLEQTYPNTEIIVLDDASTDATVYLLKQYLSQITLIENETNKGQGTRRNEGMKIAQGDYIYFMDSDDWLEKEAIEASVKQAEESKAELVRFNGQAFYEGDQGLIKEGNYDFSGILQDKELYTGEEALNKNRQSFSPSPCLYLVKKDVIDKHDLKFLEGVLHEDEYFTTLLFTNIQRMTYLNEDFYHRRYRTASTMTAHTNKHKLKSFDSYLIVFKALEEEYQIGDNSDQQKKFIKRQMLSIYNGLLTSDVSPEMKWQLKSLNSITIKDKLLLTVSKLKQNIMKYKNVTK